MIVLDNLTCIIVSVVSVDVDSIDSVYSVYLMVWILLASRLSELYLK